MISILDPRAWIAAVVLCVASVGIGYWRGNVAGKAAVHAAWDKERAEQQAAVTAATISDMTAGQRASATYQQGLQDEKERIRVVRETIVRTVSGHCFDADGLRLANKAISGVPPASSARLPCRAMPRLAIDCRWPGGDGGGLDCGYCRAVQGLPSAPGWTG